MPSVEHAHFHGFFALFAAGTSPVLWYLMLHGGQCGRVEMTAWILESRKVGGLGVDSSLFAFKGGI